MSFAVAATAFVNFDGELWLAKRLTPKGPLVLFDGRLDANGRRERLRKAILERGPDAVCAHERRGDLTYRQAFERLYGENL